MSYFREIDKQLDMINIIHTFLSYANPTSLENKVIPMVAQTGEVLYDIEWTARIGDCEGISWNPYKAMEKCIRKVEAEKAKEDGK
jgi:hypothetical protein